jgi:Tol biopolymer transport system component
MLTTDASQSIDIKVVEADHTTITPLFASGTASEYAPSISPDGRYVAYTSTESGTDEVYVETLPPGVGDGRSRAAAGRTPSGRATAARCPSSPETA